ncbi:MAG: ribbon-helix-helix protein, CopG family [Candidatus Binatia bacterium]
MASPKVKATYSLDVETVRALERTARRWNVSRSAALRRAIQAAATEAGTGAGSDALEALGALQRSLDLSSTGAKAWATRSRRERQAASRRREK